VVDPRPGDLTDAQRIRENGRFLICFTPHELSGEERVEVSPAMIEKIFSVDLTFGTSSRLADLVV